MRERLRRLLVAALACALLLAAAGCSATVVSAFIRDIKKGEYMDARQTYGEKIAGNAQRERLASDELDKLFTGELNGYNKGKKPRRTWRRCSTRCQGQVFSAQRSASTRRDTRR